MIDQVLVRSVHRTVGDLLQREQSSRRARGEAPLSGADEQQYVRGLATRAVRDLVEQQMAAGDIPLTPEEEAQVVEGVHARMYGAGQLQSLLDNDQLEDIDINGCDEVWLSYADGTRQRGEPVAGSDEELIELVQVLASYAGRSGRPFDAANPELDLRLPDGSRLSATQSVSGRPAVSIRRHRFEKASLEDLIGNQTISPELGSFFGAAVRARFNMLICGATGAGKTTLLRALASQIPPMERIITVENSLELGLRADTASHPNCVEFEARLPNSEGKGEITMAQLVRRSLRMNPDRVIVGEVLGPEIVTMLSAMTQGNDGSLSTIHSRSARESFERIATYALTSEHRMPREAAFSMVAGGIDVVIHMDRDLSTGKRKVAEVLEVNGYDPALGGSPATNELFLLDDSGVAQWTGVVPARSTRLRAAGWGTDNQGWVQ